MVEVHNISIGYNLKNTKRRKIVASNISFRLEPGKLVCLLGKNGEGKSTLLRSLAGIQSICTGSILINGTNIKKISSHKLSKMVSIVTANPPNIGHTKVFDLIAMGRYPHTNVFASLQETDKSIIHEAINACKVSNLSHLYFDTLSDGEKQRVMIARAVVQDTPVILLDEPTAHLDIGNRFAIMDLLRSLAKTTQKTILSAIHDFDIALKKADEFLLINKNGVLKGFPEDLILEDKIVAFLNFDDYSFDVRELGYRKEDDLGQSFSVTGKEELTRLISNALRREGLCLSADKNKAEIHIVASDDNIIELISHKGTEKFFSIKNLVDFVLSKNF